MMRLSSAKRNRDSVARGHPRSRIDPWGSASRRVGASNAGTGWIASANPITSVFAKGSLGPAILDHAGNRPAALEAFRHAPHRLKPRPNLDRRVGAVASRLPSSGPPYVEPARRQVVADERAIRISPVSRTSPKVRNRDMALPLSHVSKGPSVADSH